MNHCELLKDGLARLELEVGEAEQETLLWVLQELLRWNRTYNLTAITDAETAIEKHLIDSLTLLPCLGPAERLLDIGSGAGFPALPLKIVRPELEIVSVDAVAKKIRFQSHVARKLKLEKFRAWHGRIESLPDEPFGQQFDLVVARAFSSLPKLIELAQPCLAGGGQIIAMKGPEGDRELEEAADDMKRYGMTCKSHLKLTLPWSKSERQLLILTS